MLSAHRQQIVQPVKTPNSWSQMDNALVHLARILHTTQLMINVSAVQDFIRLKIAARTVSLLFLTAKSAKVGHPLMGKS